MDSLSVLPDQTVFLSGRTGSASLPGIGINAFQAAKTPDIANYFVAKFYIENPGSVSGYAFQDYNQNGVPDAYEMPLAGLVIYDDANGNGVLDGAVEKYSTAQYVVM